jgi:hypothetical protein
VALFPQDADMGAGLGAEVRESFQIGKLEMGVRLSKRIQQHHGDYQCQEEHFHSSQPSTDSTRL